MDYTLQAEKRKLVILFLSIFIASFFDELYANHKLVIIKRRGMGKFPCASSQLVMLRCDFLMQTRQAIECAVSEQMLSCKVVQRRINELPRKIEKIVGQLFDADETVGRAIGRNIEYAEVERVALPGKRETLRVHLSIPSLRSDQLNAGFFADEIANVRTVGNKKTPSLA